MNSGAAADTAGYYFTKERVTLEERNAGAEKTVPFARQLRAIFTDKYMLIIYAYFLIYTLGTSIKNLSLVYFCNYVLGTYNDGVTQTMISVIGGIPMGSGIFAVWPLAKKFGKRNVMLAGFILYAIGGAICWAFPANMTVIAVAMVGICTGIFNGLLGHAGYIAPEIVNGVTVAAEQSAAVKGVITFGFVRLEVFTGVILAALLNALLTPDMTTEQNAGDFTDLLVRQEELKTLPFGEVWAEYCRRCGVPEDGAWLPEVRRYEKTILEARA